MSNSAMEALSSKLSLGVSPVTLTFWNFRFRRRPLVGGNRSTNLDNFANGAVKLSSNIALVV
jgi:hypothetical protein